MKKAVIAMDIGGTTVETAGVTRAGDIVGNIDEYESPSEKSKDQIIHKLAGFVLHATEAVKGYEVDACGVGMPGPFDYVRGISHMEHKFQAIRDVELGQELESKTGLPFRFINDAAAFGLGVSWKQLPDAERIIAITVGTGLGSSFIENGKNIEVDSRIPVNGELWNLPYERGIIEDTVSARGICMRYAEKTGRMLSPKVISERSRQGDPDATDVYREVGMALGQVLNPYVESFQPEKIVVGGKIGRSLDLFGPAAEQALGYLSSEESRVIRAKAGNLALFGAAKHAFTA